MLTKIAQLTLAIHRKLGTLIKTLAAQSNAIVGSRSKVLYCGEVINISETKDNLSIGEDCLIAGQITAFAHSGKIKIGDWFFLGAGSKIWSSADVTIGERVLISHNVEIHDTESHPFDPEERFAQTRAVLKTGHPTSIQNIKSAPIVIGDDVWIGFGATIRKGVTIGNRAIIGARAIVDRDIPADTLVKSRSEFELNQKR